MKKYSVGMLAVGLLLAYAGSVGAQNADVTFFVIGKHANFSQDTSGERQSVDYSFFSEISTSASDSSADNCEVADDIPPLDAEE